MRHARCRTLGRRARTCFVDCRAVWTADRVSCEWGICPILAASFKPNPPALCTVNANGSLGEFFQGGDREPPAATNLDVLPERVRTDTTNPTASPQVPSTNGNFLDLQLVVTVPLNATMGPITIETPHGNATTTNSFSLLVRPALTIRSLPDKKVELWWPAINGFALQRADSLTSTSVWVGATILSSRVTEGIRYATLTNAVPNRFFRLHRP